MGKYLDPRADLTFKKIFGLHKNLVISLLNALLPLKEDERVESIEYWPAEKIPERTDVEKYSIVDVCCKDNKNREFIVEMQMSWTEAFKKRVLLNASKAYVAQSTKGMMYENLQPVYALNFVNDVFIKDVPEFYHYYHLVHDKFTDKVIDGLHLIFVELPKFKAHTIAEKKMQVLWLRFLTEINENTKDVPAELLENAEVSEALEIVERAAFNDEEMRTYDKFWDSISSYRTLMYGFEKKMEEVEQQQKEVEQQKNKVEQQKNKVEQQKNEIEQQQKEVERQQKEVEQQKKDIEQRKQRAENKLRQNKIDAARKLKAMNVMTTDQIAEITGLTAEEVSMA